ncbi:putative alpha-isopropylmalate/homocitrate synthase family transferase [Melioribacter roseus P3M-2]|uniref:Citramalate synthase n=1 Tax=Melioribacter roseus (strain DSM 23840 / JCM 17771 / VKM B-2668 / P3M-2) TaxID=1191523 RepID=I7A0J4_MELRP|nr:citramalate synthase [Melioribacter roseus]AFN73476.1 putative alpha-isopropylmalate/homocitrate synthase family transferase [Melioribacter roseus P3M-2]
MLVEIFDTTLRDGTQGEGVNLSVQDKLLIAKKLDEFGIDIIEGGWPGSNPKDEEFFKKAKELDLQHAKLCAFGSTARSVKDVESDYNLNTLINSETPIITIFGKTWKLHSQKGLGLTDAENEELIYKSVKYLKSHGRRVIFDAEHFFDGFKDDPEFALKMLEAAVKGGADTLVLCDTNGGALPEEVYEITKTVKEKFDVKIGIHTHNDSELAVANSLAAVRAGARHVQGTVNGLGERCGNANLCSIIPNLILKMNYETNQKSNLASLTSVSNYVYEIMNLHPNTRAAFTGKSAFAHKGGVHVSAVMKESRMYEHIEPELVGNKQRVLVSDLSGQSNVRYKAKEVGVDIGDNKELSKKIVNRIKSLEYNGYQFDGAEASFELLLRAETDEFSPFFKVLDSKVNVFYDEEGHSNAEAVLKIEVNGEIEHTASDGDGPVNALDKALRKALTRFYPEVADIKLVDYKVRVLDEKEGTAAKVRVMIESSDGKDAWGTVGVSTNIIEASFKALSDSINYKLFQYYKNKQFIEK